VGAHSGGPPRFNKKAAPETGAARGLHSRRVEFVDLI
jgi:hypothetical protein